MAKNEYPSYSVYIQRGGQLKNPLSYSKRVQIFELDEAQKAAHNCWEGMYKRKEDVLLLRYDAPYKATIVQLLGKEV